MEADIKNGVIDPNSLTTMKCGENDMRKKESKEVESPFFSPALKSSTPVVEKDTRGFVLRIPFVERDDSGFSEATLSSTPLSSLGRTSCSSLASSSSLTDCDISPINSRPISKRRRRYRHSDPGLSTLAMRIQFLEDNGGVLSLHSQNDITAGESMDHLENNSQPTISSKKPLKRNVLPEMMEMKLNHSCSLSSMSDELEASFQEMSLEENSSQSSTSINSSPGISSPLHSLSRSESPQDNTNPGGVHSEIGNVTLISNSGSSYVKPSKTSIDSANKSQILNTMQDSDQSEFHFHDSIDMVSNVQCGGKVDFAASLSLAPKLPTFQASLDSSVQTESVIQEGESTICDTLSQNKHFSALHSNSNSKGNQGKEWSLSSYHAVGESLPLTSQQACSSSFNHTTDLESFDCQSRHQVSATPNHLCDESLFKSPTKRICNTQINNTAISPFKMRKLSFSVEKSKNLANVKRNLTLTDSFLPSNSSTHKLERCPQYYNINLLPEVRTKEDSNDSPISTKDPNHTFDPSLKDGQEITDSKDRKLSCIIQTFSPPEPSRLIGRRVGLAKCDIVGELTRQNFIGCLECVFQYLSDIDLTSVARVSRLWRMSLENDRHSFHRFQRYQLTQRRFKLVLGKENVPDKPKDNVAPSVTTAKGPLYMVQQQAATPQQIPFNKEEVQLLWDDTKRTCPKCVGTALDYPGENRAACMRGNCDFVFCTLCFSAFHHPKPCKPLFRSTSKADLAGTRKSKRTLKRL